MKKQKPNSKNKGGSDAAPKCSRDDGSHITSVTVRGMLLDQRSSRYFLDRESAEEVVLSSQHHGLRLLIGDGGRGERYPSIDLEGVRIKISLAVDVGKQGAITATLVVGAPIPVYCPTCKEDYYCLRRILRAFGVQLVKQGVLADFVGQWADDVNTVGFVFTAPASDLRSILVKSDRIAKYIAAAARTIAIETDALMEKKVSDSVKENRVRVAR
jgi:hypothetical protein